MPRIGARLPTGTRESILSITADQLKTLYARTYQPHQMCLIAVGDMSAIGGERGLASLLRSEKVFEAKLAANAADSGGATRLPGTVGDGIAASAESRAAPYVRVPHQLSLRPPVFCVIPERDLDTTSVSLEFYSPLR